MRRWPWLLMLAGCGAAAPPRASEAEAPRTSISPTDFPEGECGGFAELGVSEPRPLLAGRLRVRAPGGTADVPRPHDIMGAPPAAQLESRLFLEHGGARFVVFAVELLRAPTADLARAARADAGVGYRVGALEVDTPLRAAIAVRERLDLSDEAVEIATVYTVTEDDLVQRVTFFVTPDAARDGGCERLAVELASTLATGGRQLPEEPGPRVLEGTIGLDLPTEHRLLVQEGPDFTVYRVFPVLPLGGGEGSLGIYIGGHPSFGPPDDAARSAGQLFGQPIEWRQWEADGLFHRQALAPVQGGGAYAHVFITADDDAVLERLGRVAQTLRAGVSAPPLAACPEVDRLPAVEVEAEVLAIPALQTLLRAEVFSVHRRGWDVARIDPALAWDELTAHPRARDALLYLAVHGTTAGRIYGLAGLYLHDRETFDRVVCAVRSVLGPTVTVRRACGSESVPTGPLIEAPAGVRGQRHWSAEQWARALYEGTADLRGGGLAWRLALGPTDAGAIEEHGWELGGDGYAPALEPNDRRAASLPRFTPAPRHPTVVAVTQNGGMCRTRADGRVACWGGTPASERRGATLLPDWVRWPAALAIDLGLGCVLDADGQRACFALLEPALDARGEACSGAIHPTEVVMRRFDDGPWRSLGNASDVCGIHGNGRLRCFASSNRYNPEWAEIDGVGIGASYAVPIEGEVRGLTTGEYFDGYAWTADGSIWTWNNETAPRPIGRVEGVVEVSAGNDDPWVFARATDGRVFVLGAGRQSDGTPLFYGSFIDEDSPWTEVAELRGARVTIGPHHACALHGDGRVACWGQHSGYLPGVQDQYDEPPQDVPALRGALSLFVGEWLTCGELRGGAWRCIGSHLDAISNGAVPEERREALDVRPDRIAAAVR